MQKSQILVTLKNAQNITIDSAIWKLQWSYTLLNLVRQLSTWHWIDMLQNTWNAQVLHTHLFTTNKRNTHWVELSATVNNIAVHIGAEHTTYTVLWIMHAHPDFPVCLATHFSLHHSDCHLRTGKCLLKWFPLVKCCSTISYCKYGKSLTLL